MPEGKSAADLRVSFVLLDWSCRESFHTLHYLNKQTVSRDQYEIIWIEYYSRRAPQIAEGLESCRKSGQPPLVDQWIVLDMPEQVYYHKHLLYNVGIVKSRGKIVVICDSDVMVKPTFVESILREFEKDKDIVLHLDEVRNDDRTLYPFNSPSFDRITGPGCKNWADGKTTGLADEVDPHHTRNYGACFCALKEDLIGIGGADEHLDYLGHVCGPYEMTFRLVNAGKKEVWHQSEFLYHTWHPGTDGERNYLGPHDGRNMSTTAFEAIRSQRVHPLVENPAVAMLRDRGIIDYADPADCLISCRDLGSWAIPEGGSHRIKWGKTLDGRPLAKLSLRLLLLKTTLTQVYLKAKTKASGGLGKANPQVLEKSLFDNMRVACVFAWRMWCNNAYATQACEQVLQRLAREGATRVMIFGAGPLVEILKTLLRSTPLHVDGIYAAASPEALKGFGGKVIIGSLTGVAERLAQLEAVGIPRANIVRIQ